MTSPTRGNVHVNGRPFAADFGLLTRSPLQSNVQLQDAGAEPSERSLSRFGWKRSQTDFVFGAGQEWFDQEDQNDRRRFYASRGATMKNRGKLTSLGEPTLLQSHAGSTSHMAMASGNYCYWAVGATLYRLGASGTTSTTCTGTSGNTILDVVVLGGFVYVCDGTDVRRATDGATAFSTFGVLAADGFVVGSNRLLAYDANTIFEIDNTGAKFNGNDVFVHPHSGFSWKGGVNAPNGIYIWGDDGVNSEVFLVVPTDATGELAYPFPATAWPVGELVRSMVEYGGVVVMATTRGIRLATITGSGFLSYGPVREASGDTAILLDAGESFFFGWSSETVDGTTYSGLGRLGMDRFTSTLAASYEPWLLQSAHVGTVIDGGTIIPTSGALTPYPMVAVSAGGTIYLYGEAASTVASPIVLDPGKVTYGTPEKKAFVSLTIEITGLAGDDSVSATGDFDGTNYTLSGSNEGGGIWRFTYSSALSGYVFHPIITVTLGTPASHAEVALSRWTLRSLVLPEQVEMIECGIILDKETASDGYTVEHRDPFGDFTYLHDLALAKTVCEFQIGDQIDTGYVDSFVLQRQGVVGSQGADMTLALGESGAFVEGIWLLRFVSASDVTA